MRRAITTVWLSGTLRQKLEAIAELRFVGIELLATRLSTPGNRGDFSLEVLNDDYRRRRPLPAVAERDRRTAVWLAEDLLRQSTPLPGRVWLRPVA